MVDAGDTKELEKYKREARVRGRRKEANNDTASLADRTDFLRTPGVAST